MDRAHITPRKNKRTDGEWGRDATRNAIFGVLRDALCRDNRLEPVLFFFSHLPESSTTKFNEITLGPFNRSCKLFIRASRAYRGTNHEVADGEI